MNVGPLRLFHGQPVSVGLEPPLKHEFRLLLLRGNHADNVFVQSARHGLGVDICAAAVLVFALGKFLNLACRSGHRLSFQEVNVIKGDEVSKTASASRERSSSVIWPSLCNRSASVMPSSARRIHCSSVCHKARSVQPP